MEVTPPPPPTGSRLVPEIEVNIDFIETFARWLSTSRTSKKDDKTKGSPCPFSCFDAEVNTYLDKSNKIVFVSFTVSFVPTSRDTF